LRDAKTPYVNIAVVGYGYWGPRVARAMREAVLHVGVYDSDPAALERARVAGFPRVGSILDGEAVVICTPPDTHAALIAEALQAGRHVWAEKPIAPTHAEAQALVALAREKDRVLFVDHTFSFAPAVLIVARSISDEVSHVEGVRSHLVRPRAGADVLGDLLPHDLSVLSACGLHATEIQAAQRDRDASVFLRFNGGATGSLYLSWASAIKTRRMAFYGADRTVLYDHTDERMPVRIYLAGGEAALDAWTYGEVRCPAVPTIEPLAVAVREFQRAIAGEARDNADEALAIQRVTDAARRSAERGAWEAV